MFPCVKELTHFDGALKVHKILDMLAQLRKILLNLLFFLPTNIFFYSHERKAKTLFEPK